VGEGIQRVRGVQPSQAVPVQRPGDYLATAKRARLALAINSLVFLKCSPHLRI